MRACRNGGKESTLDSGASSIPVEGSGQRGPTSRHVTAHGRRAASSVRPIAAVLVAIALAFGIAGVGKAGAANAPPQSSSSARLPNSVVAAVANGKLRSVAASSVEAQQPLTLTVTLNRTDQSAFDSFVTSVETPNSPQYQRFMSQRAIADRFGPSRATYNNILGWLQTQGFTLVQGSVNRLTITVRGTRQKAEHAFAVTIGDYQVGGHRLFATQENPAVPAQFARDIKSITGLSDLGVPMAAPNEQVQKGGSASDRCRQAWTSSPGPVQDATTNLQDALLFLIAKVGNQLSGLFTYGLDTTGFCIGATWADNYPSQARAYLKAIGKLPKSDPKIGLLEFDSYKASDVADWLTYMGMDPSAASRLSEVNVNGGVPVPGAGESEVQVDIATVLGLSPFTSSNYVVYDAPSNTSFEQMFQAMINDGDNVISNSWSQCEDQTSLADAQGIDSVLASAAASGITVVNGAGDHGSTCLDGSANTVGVPADSPHATAVGGTTPTFGPGLSYGSESWWNTPGGGSGGFGVSKYFASPTYQQGVSGSTMRSVPDISVDADPSAGVEICQSDAGGCPSGLMYGGTSMAAPEVAAEVANLDANLGHNVGDLNGTLYPLAGTSAFHSPASMGSDFAHVGLGSPDFTSIQEALSGATPGVPSGLISQAIALGQPPADGSTQSTVRVDLYDANGLPVAGKSVSLSSNSGTSALIAPSTATTDANGMAEFTATDTVPETVTLTATDTTDGVTLSTQPSIQFVPPAATGAQIYGGPAQVTNDGTSQAAITVYLENGLGQPASGKTVSLSQGNGSAVITPAGSSTPGTTAVTNSAGNAVFNATDTNAETVDFTATDVTDGSLPVPGSVSVNFAPSTATCTTSLPTAASGTSVSAFATDFSYATEGKSFPGNVTGGGCGDAESAPAFDRSGNAYVSDENDGTIHVLSASGGTASAANQLPDANFGQDTLGQLVFGPDGSLYAGLINFPSSINNPEIVQLDPATGAILRVVANAASGLPDCPFIMAVDPLSGDLFTDDECYGDSSNQISRISDPTGATPTVSDYITTGGCNLGLAFAPNGTLYLANCNGEVDSIGGTNTTSPAVTTVADVVGTPFSVAVTGSNSSGQATSLDVFTTSGNVVAVDLTLTPAVTSTAATGTSPFYITASSANGCAYGTIPGTIVRIGPPSCASSPSTSSGPQIALSGPGATSPAAGASVTFNAQLSNVTSPSGTPVLFTVSGANPQVKLVDASATGSASFTYSALHPGTDMVTATTTVGTSALTSNPIAFTWAAGKDTSFLTLNGSQEIGALGKPATFVASLSDVSQSPPTPVNGGSITVLVGLQSCTITTNATGSGSCQVTPTSAGLLPVNAVYSGTSALTSSAATNSFFAGGPSTTPPSMAPVITSANTDTVSAGTAFTFPVTTTGSPTPAITLASGSTLPTGVTLTDNGNGTATLAGTSSVAAGTYKFTIQAANTVTPNYTQAFTLTVTAPTLTSIAVTPVNPSITKGGTQQFTATGTYSDKSTANITSLVTWTSGTTTVATITTGGLATGVGAGSSTITAALGGVSGTTKLTVTAPTLTSIAVTPVNPSITKSGTQQFTATGTYSDKSTANLTSLVTWTSGTTTVASITTGGLATGVGAGSSTITAALGGVSGTTKLTVTAPALTSIAVTPANPSITKSGTQQFTATGTYSDKSTANLTSLVTWTSGTTTVASITTGGLATGVGAGSSTITAALGGVSGTTKLTVTAPALTSIAVTPANPSITKSGTQQFTATGTYSDKSTANLTSLVTWTSGTTTVASITTGGLATGVGAGSSTITAALGGVSGTTKLTVTAPTLTSIAVTPVNPSITKGGTQQFTATGTYSDKSTANITSLVTWTSGTTTVATITTGGLATGVGAGSSTITAALGGVSGTTKLTVTAPTAQVSLLFKGSINYANSGALLSGGFTISKFGGIITSIQGTGTIPGLKGGTASVTVDIHRSLEDFFGPHQLYVGSIEVKDSGAHLETSAFVFDGNLTESLTGQVSGVAYGLRLGGHHQARHDQSFRYKLLWTI